MSAPALDRPFKLPVWGTLAAAVRETCASFRVYARLARFPLAIFLIFSASVFAVRSPALMRALEGGAASVAEFAALLLAGAVSALVLLAAVPALTAWHRYLILGPTHPAARIGYSFRQEEWKYVKAALVVGGLWLVVVVVIELFLPRNFPKPPSIEYHVLNYMLDAVGWLLIMRWSLLFPAAATGQPLKGRRAEWLARGNTFRLWVVVMLPETMSWLCNLLSRGAFIGFERGADLGSHTIAYAVASSIATIFFLAFSVAALSISYRQIMAAVPQETAP